MNNHKMTFGLVAFYAAMVFVVGCIPEDSLEWSEDGSVGLLRVKSALYLVDGQSGRLTEIAKENIQPWPDISADGSLIAYCDVVKCSSLSEGLKMLPAGHVKMIEHYAKLMREEILKGSVPDDDFPPLAGGPFENAAVLRGWVIRYMCEKADKRLAEKLGSEGVEKGKAEEIGYFRLIVVRRDALGSGKVVATSTLQIWKPHISPNGKDIAYLVTEPEEKREDHMPATFGLFVASPQQNIGAMRVASPVAIGYDWRADSKALLYLQRITYRQAEREGDASELLVCTLKERIVADGNDNLLAEPADIGEQGAIGTHNCKGEARDLAGTMFDPWMKVKYGLSGRIFFSSVGLSVPISKVGEGKWSLFCYDSVTGAVTDVLPLSVSEGYSPQVVHEFSLSPDGRKVLLPMSKNRFAIYKLGESSAEVPIAESEGFGDENVSEFFPAWKGNDEISCLVSEKSHFLVKEGQEAHNRKEIVILGADGKFRRVLSESWENWPEAPVGAGGPIP